MERSLLSLEGKRGGRGNKSEGARRSLLATWGFLQGHGEPLSTLFVFQCSFPLEDLCGFST